MKPINTFIFPCLNNIEGLVKSVESLYKYTPDNFQIIVVFNGTMNDYLSAHATLNDKVHLWIKPYRNLGFGKSMNQGIKLALTDFVTIANDDVEVLYDSWWQDVMDIFDKTPNLGGFNPHSFINKKHTGDRAIEYEIKDEYTKEDIEKMQKFFPKWYVGCCTYFTICKKAMFDKIGLFDESFGLGSGEDYDLAIRAARGGYLIAGGSLVMVKHWWGGTKDNMPKGESNYNLIAAGNQRLTEKWGNHCQEVERQLADGRMTPEQASEMKGGWSVSGAGGYDEPADKDKVQYADKKWFQEINL